MSNDSRQRYRSVSKTFHWLMTVLIGWQQFKFGDRIAEGESGRNTVDKNQVNFPGAYGNSLAKVLP